MAYTEIKQRNKKKYYYRVISVRNRKKVSKKRVYLGLDLSKPELSEKIKKADEELNLSKNKKVLKELEKIKPKIIKILKKNKIRRAGIFGSYVRGEQKKKSDIDILILPPKTMSLLDFVHVRHELEDKVGKKVDLVSYRVIHPILKERILKEEVKIIW